MGAIDSLNRAMSMADCNYVTFPSADNYIKQGMYEKSLALLEKYPQAGLCCSDPLYLDEKTGKIHMNKLNLSEGPRYFSPAEVISLYRQKGFCVGNICHTVVVNKSVLAGVSTSNHYFDPELKWHADFFALNAVAFRSGICYLPEGFGIWRQEAGSYSQRRTPWSVRKQVYLRMWKVLDQPLNRDIKNGFKYSGVFAEFTYSVLGVLLSQPRHYEYFTRSYTGKAVFASVRALFWTYAPKIPLARRIYRLFKRVKKGLLTTVKTL